MDDKRSAPRTVSEKYAKDVEPRSVKQTTQRTTEQPASVFSPSANGPQNAASNNSTKLPSLVVMWVALAATIGLNALFEVTKLGGVTSANVSNQVFTWFTPAGYVFSIWTVIYAGLALWLIRYPKSMPENEQGFNATLILFVLSGVLNVVWLTVWHFS